MEPKFSCTFLNVKPQVLRITRQMLVRFFLFFFFANFALSFTLFQGGYNLSSISKSMAMCTSVLLGDPPPALVTPLPPPHHSAVATINEVIRVQAPYWRSLRIHGQ